MKTSENTLASTLIVATAGHVDHGKTALVRHLTGTNTDTLAEEKARGLTINLGYAYHHFSSAEPNAEPHTIGFVDVPGHTDFINNMLAGVGGVDAALLVIAADDGIMPQTREHLAVLDLLGISTGMIALTKIDRCDEAKVIQVSEAIQNLLAGTSLENSPLFPVSNMDKTGISELQNYLENLSTSKQLKQEQTVKRRTRYLVDRSFAVKGIGTVVTGSLRTGQLKIGDNLLCTQTDELARIKTLRQDQDDLISANAGQRIAANVNLDRADIDRGQWLIDPLLNHPVSRLDGQLTFLQSAPKLKSSALYHLHIGASHRLVNINPLDEDSSLFQLKLKMPIACNYGDRFIIRDPASNHTIGGGKVIDTFVPRRQRASPARVRFLIGANQEDDAALRALINSQEEGLDFSQFEICRNLSDQWASQLLELNQDSFMALQGKDSSRPTLISHDFFREHSAKIKHAVSSFHINNPSKQGISEPVLSQASELPGNYQFFQSILQAFLEIGELKRSGSLLHLPNHRTQLSREEEEFIAKIRPILAKSGRIPPRTRELVEMTGIPLAALERILKQTTKAGSLVRVAENRHYLPETIAELAEFTEQLMSETDADEGFSVIQFRDKSEIGRNLCIELLEYFDSVGFTKRDGNSRFVRTAKENIFGRE
ncbi:MAG: selenocysteine-specific translation elongation factor [Pseudohongiellaceae bacterium]